MSVNEEDAGATVEFKRRIARDAGGLLSDAAAAEVLGWSVHEVRRAVAERRLLAVIDTDAQLLPACQFVDGRPLKELPRILAAVAHPTGWRILQYLIDPEEGLSGKRPLDLLQGTREEIEKAVRFARRLEQ